MALHSVNVARFIIVTNQLLGSVCLYFDKLGLSALKPNMSKKALILGQIVEVWINTLQLVRVFPANILDVVCDAPPLISGLYLTPCETIL